MLFLDHVPRRIEVSCLDLAIGHPAMEMQTEPWLWAMKLCAKIWPVAVVLVDPVALRPPDDVPVHQVGHLRGLDEDAAVDGLPGDDDVLAASGIAVVPVHPDAGAVAGVQRSGCGGSGTGHCSES